MSVQAVYEVHIDLTGNRTFGEANEDLSSYWKQMRWQLGTVSSFDSMERSATLEMVLKNEDGRFSPEHGSGLDGFEPGALLRVRTVFDSITRQHFIGWIDPGGIRPAPGTRGRRETVITASGFLSRLMSEEVSVPVQEGKRTDEVINTLVEKSKIYPPGMTGWLLGLAGFMELGQTSRLSAGISDYAIFEAGQTRFNYAGDNWEEGVSVFGALRDVVESEGEGALLFVDRQGKIIFKSRHWPYQDQVTSLDAALTDGDIKEDGFVYAYGTRILNDVIISLRPRKVGGSVEKLGSIDRYIGIAPGKSQTVRVRYDDGSGNRIGGKDVVTPVPNTDYTAKSGPTSGADLTSSVSVTLNETATGAELTFTNNGGQTAYVQAGAQVRGVKITDFGHQEVEHEDETSILAYGRQADRRSLQLLDDQAFAKGLAEWLVYMRKDPSGEIEAITIVANKSTALMDLALGLTVGDRISVSEGQTGSSGEYYIVGERHWVENRYHHLVTWTLRPAPATTGWVLGEASFSNLDNSARLMAL